MSATTPNPMTVFGARKAPAVTTAIAAVVTPNEPGKIVRPGLVTSEHDGVVKAKHVKKGQKVRAFIHGKAVGGERVVGKVTRIDDGASVEIEWASGHPTAQYKAAYRFHDAALQGSAIKRPALIAYQEV